MRGWCIIIDPTDEATRPPNKFFRLDPNEPDTSFYTTQRISDLLDIFNDPDFKHYNGRGIGLGWQDLLRPPSTTQFIPDKRIWAILYAWRLPGFDIDGDGFIGVPNLSSTAPAAGTASTGANGDTRIAAVGLRLDPNTGLFTELHQAVPIDDAGARPFDDRIAIADNPEPTDPQLDGAIEVPFVEDLLRGLGCGGIGVATMMTLVLGLGLTRLHRRYR